MILTSTEPNFLQCCFPSKIKQIWCCKPSCTFGRPKNLSSTWNIDMAVYYWKCPQGQRYRKAYNIIFIWFLMENSIVKKLVPWMLKSPLTSVLNEESIWNFQAFMNSKKHSCHGNYMRKYGICLLRNWEVTVGIVPCI